MNFPNALKGVKKIYTSEILLLLAGIAFVLADERQDDLFVEMPLVPLLCRVCEMVHRCPSWLIEASALLVFDSCTLPGHV